MDGPSHIRKRPLLGLVLACSFLFPSRVAVSQHLRPDNNKARVEAPQKPKLEPSDRAAEKPDWFYTALEANYLLLNATDLVTTFYGLERGAREANPLVRGFVRKRPVIVLVKGGLTLATLWSFREVRKENRKAAVIALGVLNAFYALVVTNNIQVVVRLGR
ncbi:MAG: DUF5658 family protein [bacterium]